MVVTMWAIAVVQRVLISLISSVVTRGWDLTWGILMVSLGERNILEMEVLRHASLLTNDWNWVKGKLNGYWQNGGAWNCHHISFCDIGPTCELPHGWGSHHRLVAVSFYSCWNENCCYFDLLFDWRRNYWVNSGKSHHCTFCSYCYPYSCLFVYSFFGAHQSDALGAPYKFLVFWWSYCVSSVPY